MPKIIFDDNIEVLRRLADESVNLIYTDPPFNTQRCQKRTRLKTLRDDENGDRTGFKGNRYKTVNLGSKSFHDCFDDFMTFIEPRLVEAHRILTRNGSFFFHIDYREVHYCKVLLDAIFGRDCFMNEIIWAYDYGARTRKRWSAKHDNILWYVKDPGDYVFNYDEIERIPYMAPGLVGKEKAKKGKTPTDTWWHTIVSPNGKEKTGYPTQKPVGIINRIVKVHSREGDVLLDFFAGSGTLGEVAAKHGRDFILVDNNPEALEIMAQRLAFANPEIINYKEKK